MKPEDLKFSNGGTSFLKLKDPFLGVTCLALIFGIPVLIIGALLIFSKASLVRKKVEPSGAGIEVIRLSPIIGQDSLRLYVYGSDSGYVCTKPKESASINEIRISDPSPPKLSPAWDSNLNLPPGVQHIFP